MMALNIKTEPLRIEEPSSVVELSSDDDNCVVENKNTDPEPKPKRPERLRSPDTHCSICLDELSNRCYSESCCHMFCFECLKRWATITSSCPLCKKDFKTILHTFNEQGLHETYVVPLPERHFTPRISLRPYAELFSSEVYNDRVYNVTLFIDLMQRDDRLINNLNNQNENLTIPDQLRNHENFSHRNYSAAATNYHRNYYVNRRVQIYTSNIWAEPLPDISGRFRDCSLDFYRENPSQTHRLHGFVNRDVFAVRSIFTIESDVRSEALTNSEITNIIMQAVLDHDIRGAQMAYYLRPYLRRYTDHFCHELFNFANSPYDMIGYDRNVQYSSLENHSMAHILQQNVAETVGIPVTTFASTQSETIILDSTDSDSIIESPRPHDVIILSSTEDDSEIEILEHHIRPTYDLSHRDQPSTSTGIRDSLNRPSSRYNLKRRRLCRPTNSSGRFMHVPRLKRQSGLRRREESSNYISSSNDEEPTTIASLSDSSQAIHDVETGILYGKRKKKIKRSKNKQKTDDTSELHFSSTNQSYADWSSSDESDGRSQIRHTSDCFNIAPRT